MASFADIKEVRLRISDPFPFINFLEVANAAALPTSPANQTGYKTTDTSDYYSTDEESPVTVPDDYEKEELQISDARLSTWIDANGVDWATCQALRQIIAQLGKQLGGIKRNSSGAEDVEYNTIKDLYDYYKNILAGCAEQKRSNENNSTGRWGTFKQPEIAGDNL